jgi:hypothetical protein
VAVQAACRALYPTQCNGVYTPTEVKVAGQTLTYNVELYCPCTDPAGDDTVVLASPPPSPASPSPSPPVSTASSPPPVSAANSAPVYAADYAATGAELTEAPVVESVDGVRAVAHVTPLHPMRQWVAQGGSQGSRRRGRGCARPSSRDAEFRGSFVAPSLRKAQPGGLPVAAQACVKMRIDT